ncbi:cell division protein ZapE [Demequina muriae]|uniref:Cell division protein ZapE n=1 Tax=Demequina muriae TaxID=3051664 RepID=A0ABT8GKZ5_9MICO|nr:cell division protein ZapE [Demequina sp. EGI L300058]MDN4481606.1 cell division protein ZapE [Demequina sp. EGI L300058]
MTARLVGRRPHVEPEALIAALVPPPHFADASFSSYVPDPDFPSQESALEEAQAFARGVGRRGLGPLRRSSGGRGLYLDGGFGVGKTHLLVSMARDVGERAAFGTFVEYTSLVGAMGFQATRQALQQFALVCIDEFELDDPGDTVLMARLMRELADAGVALAATSNTAPGSLGKGRFAADDFRREIQAVSTAFEVATIDGPDYRGRGELVFPAPATVDQVLGACARDGGACEEWSALMEDLRHVHPSRFGAYVDGISVLGLRGVRPLPDQAQALRVVALVDRLYDRDVRIVASGHSLAEIFSQDMLRGGYRKKYLRALSRLLAMVAGEGKG